MSSEPKEIYIQSPTNFIVDNWEKLLPDWKVAPQAMAIVLFPSQFSLDREGEIIEREKDRLLKQFLAWGDNFYWQSHRQGIDSEIISPQDGTPQYSSKGKLIFDLVAVIHHSLKFNFTKTEKGCKLLEHPRWHQAVYPGLILSAAAECWLIDTL